MLNLLRFVAAICSLVACRADPAPSHETSPGSAGSAGVGTAAPAIRNETTARFVREAAACPQTGGSLSLDCPALHSLGEHALIFKDNHEAAETCAALLRDANAAIRQAASQCLRPMSPTTIAPLIGAVLDAIESEPNPAIRPQIAHALGPAHAPISPFEPRIRAAIERLAATPALEDEQTASELLWPLFPETLQKSAPQPTAEAQQLLLKLIGRSRGELYSRATKLAHLVRDKKAACAALRGAIRTDNHEWSDAGIAIADLGTACTGDVPHVIDVALSWAKAGEPDGNVLLRIDRNIDLDPAQRSRIATELQASESSAMAWKRPDVIEALKAFRAKSVRP